MGKAIVTLIGRLGKDVEKTKSGDLKMARFSVATDYWDRETKAKKANWHSVTFFGKQAEVAANYLAKGSPVVVVGELSLVEKDGRTFSNVKGQSLELIGPKNEATPIVNETARKAPSFDTNEEIPF